MSSYSEYHKNFLYRHIDFVYMAFECKCYVTACMLALIVYVSNWWFPYGQNRRLKTNLCYYLCSKFSAMSEHKIIIDEKKIAKCHPLNQYLST